jgi:uncharacterized protein YbjT (DUF2867 family)
MEQQEQGLILVAGAAPGSMGSTGYHVATMLADKGLRVRAMVHQEDDRSERLRQLGMEVVQADLLEYRSVKKAMEGVRRAYFSYPVQEGLLEATTNFAKAAKESGVELVVNLSQYLRGDSDHPTPHQKRHWLSEQIFNLAGIGAVHLEPTIFFENFRALAQPSIARSNTFYLPWGPDQTKYMMIAGEDVARVAAAVLAGPLQPNGTVLPLIGEIVSIRDIADLLTELSGTPVKYQNTPDDVWAGTLRQYGINEITIEHLGLLWKFLRSVPAWMQQTYAVTPSIESLTGVQLKTMKEYLREHKEAFFSPHLALQ